MPQVTLLRRQRTVHFIDPLRAEEVVSVTYSTPATLPRFVNLPEASYRNATPEELRANPDLQVYPKDQAATDAERQAIAQNISQAGRAAPTTFTL